MQYTMATLIDEYRHPEVYNEYMKEQVDHLLHSGTYLNPLDSKLLNGLMTVVVLITAAVCIAKICKLHLSRHPTVHQYVVFYCATAECLLCAVHWILGQYVQLDFIVQYLKLSQFLVVSHLYWSLATRTVRKEKLTTRLLIPMYSAALLYFTLVVILGCVHVRPNWVECLQPYWLLLSCAEFLLVQLFMVAGFYITRRLNEMSTMDSVRRAQKRDLWVLTAAFEISAFCGFAYDITLRALGDENIGCSGIFLHMEQIYSPVFGSFMVVKLLLPMWAMLFVFHPVESSGDHDDLLPPVTEDGQQYTSVFSPSYDRHRYRPLCHPGSDTMTSDTDFTPSPGSDLSTPVFGPLRRNASSLTPIREENTELEPSTETSDRKPILT